MSAASAERDARLPLLSEILGHDQVVAMLEQALAMKTLHHALLFVGPEGIGKRSAAISLAARLLCERRGEEACGACAACVQVGAGSHADLRREGFFYDEKRKELREHTLIEQVRVADAAGFDAFSMGEHYNIPGLQRLHQTCITVAIVLEVLTCRGYGHLYSSSRPAQFLRSQQFGF